MTITERLIGAVETEVTYADGEFIVRRGEEGREMFVIQSGAVVISTTVGGQEMVRARLGRGDFFGEMSLLESLPRHADARAVGETTLRVIGPGGLLARLRQDPSFALEMLNRLSATVRARNDELEELRRRDTALPTADEA